MQTSASLAISGTYALGLCLAIVLGLPGTLTEDGGYPSNAVRMPAAALLIALICGASGIGLFQRHRWARVAFLASAPWASIALGSVFARSLWREDVPYSAVAIVAYVPLTFLLSRPNALDSLGIANSQWSGRGGPILLSLAGVMFFARMIVASSVATGSGGGLQGLLHSLESMNSYVQRLVLCDVPLWNYMGAVVAVSIPIRSRTRAAPRGGDNASGASQPALAGQASSSGGQSTVKAPPLHSTTTQMSDDEKQRRQEWVAAGRCSTCGAELTAWERLILGNACRHHW
jgi:hypothetical protein